eukprot:TRINITY_DN9566_c0_g1_i1.p1 TRINITY_DN9566_c0_g1~~TRINITY_DN9566_c0_g1_i1.p1  ORF type:complete len:579 (-),score=165.48 TRINITY_DN9566_c0_g1_i1:205-1941(-)
MQRGLVGSEMCIRDRYQRRVHGDFKMEEDTEKELQMKEQVELAKKQRNLQQDRKALSNETQSKLRKMQNTIARLKKDYQNLVDELMQQDQTVQRNKSDINRMVSEEEQIKQIKMQIEDEKQKHESLDGKIKTLQDMMISEKQKLGGINATLEGYSHIQKQIRILENRLDKANQKFNDAMSHNNKLKAQIDSLRRERVIFENIYKRLEGELRKRREEMANKIEEANKAYERRDQAQEETNRLAQEAGKYKENMDKMMEEIKGEIHKEAQVSMLQSRKGEEKAELERLGSAVRAEEDMTRSRGDEPFAAWGAPAKTTHDIAKEYAAYRQAFAQIEAATKIQKIEDLIEKFEKAEQENFELFKFVNQLCAEIEKLEGQIKEMEKTIEIYEGQEQDQEITSEKIKKDEEELSKIELKAENYESKYQKSLKTLNSMKAMIENIFNNIECHKNISPELLGSHGVTESNIMSYIGAIEQRRDEMFLACREYAERKREAGEIVELDPIISDLVDTTAEREFHEPPSSKVTAKEIEDELAKLPMSDFEIDSEIPNLNEMSKRLESLRSKDRPESAYPAFGPSHKLHL